MIQTDEIKGYCSRLSLTYTGQELNEIILKAQEGQPTYVDFLLEILKTEARLREAHTREVCVKMSRIPPRHDLDEYDFNFGSGTLERQLNELRQRWKHIRVS